MLAIHDVCVGVNRFDAANQVLFHLSPLLQFYGFGDETVFFCLHCAYNLGLWKILTYPPRVAYAFLRVWYTRACCSLALFFWPDSYLISRLTAATHSSCALPGRHFYLLLSVFIFFQPGARTARPWP